MGNMTQFKDALDVASIMLAFCFVGLLVAALLQPFTSRPLQAFAVILGSLSVCYIFVAVANWYDRAVDSIAERVEIASQNADVTVDEHPRNISDPGRWQIDDQWRTCYVSEVGDRDYALLCQTSAPNPTFEPLVES